MILTLDIDNFFCHKKSHFDFHPGVNVILGETDSGKSAVIRSLKYLRWNRPIVNDFKSWWGGDSRIQITTSEGDIISRVEGVGIREYHLNNGKPFKAFGVDVPVEIVTAINMNETNIQNQANPYFLLNDSSGKVAEHFNKVARLDEIDLAQSNLKGWIKGIGQTITVNNSLIEMSVEGLQRFDSLTKFEIEVEVLEAQESRLEVLRYGNSHLKKLIQQVKILIDEIKSYNGLIELKPLMDKLFDLRSSRIILIDHRMKLHSLILRIKESNRDILEYQKLIPAGVLLDRLIVIVREQANLQRNRDRLNTMVLNVKKAKQTIQEVKLELSETKTYFEKIMPDICPLCGNLTKSHKHD